MFLEASDALIFYMIFREFIGHFKYWENLKYKNSRKHELTLRCTDLIGESKYDQNCMKFHQKHGKVTQNMHGASRNYRYIWDVSAMHGTEEARKSIGGGSVNFLILTIVRRTHALIIGNSQSNQEVYKETSTPRRSVWGFGYPCASSTHGT